MNMIGVLAVVLSCSHQPHGAGGLASLTVTQTEEGHFYRAESCLTYWNPDCSGATNPSLVDEGPISRLEYQGQPILSFEGDGVKIFPACGVILFMRDGQLIDSFNLRTECKLG